MPIDFLIRMLKNRNQTFRNIFFIFLNIYSSNEDHIVNRHKTVFYASKNLSVLGSHIAQWISFLPQPRGSFPGRNLSTVDCLEEWTSQSLIVDRTHLVIVSGKLVSCKKSFIVKDLSHEQLANLCCGF